MRSLHTAGVSPNFTRNRPGQRYARRGGTSPRAGQRHEHAGRAVQILSRRELGQERAVASEPARASGAIGQRVLIAIRVAMGLVFVACGLHGFVDFTPAQSGSMHGGAMAFGGALLVAGSLLPLLKGTEVIVETILDLQRALGARKLADR